MKYFLKSHKFSERSTALIAGGIAGVIDWTVMYPVDYVKTLIQSDSLTNPRYKSGIECFTREVKSKGISVIYTGYSVMVPRAFAVNAVGFSFFELAKDILYSPGTLTPKMID
jgi:solute carrier family 25 (mitochondrial carnitine/acylcarnitine transporter), member 20/29